MESINDKFLHILFDKQMMSIFNKTKIYRYFTRIFNTTILKQIQYENLSPNI